MDARLAEIETLYRTRFTAFLRTATAITGDAESGRDAVQDAFATAVRRRAEFRGDGSFDGWVWRILVNTARTNRRARAAIGVVPLQGPPSANGSAEEPERAATRALLAALPERQRLVVFLRYFADLDHAAIAEALAIRVGTVGATLNAAHAVLRRRLEEVSS